MNLSGEIDLLFFLVKKNVVSPPPISNIEAMTIIIIYKVDEVFSEDFWDVKEFNSASLGVNGAKEAPVVETPISMFSEGVE